MKHIFFLLLFTPSILFAQKLSYITGKVIFPNGSPMSGAKVSLIDLQGMEYITGQDGVFNFKVANLSISNTQTIHISVFKNGFEYYEGYLQPNGNGSVANIKLKQINGFYLIVKNNFTNDIVEDSLKIDCSLSTNEIIVKKNKGLYFIPITNLDSKNNFFIYITENRGSYLVFQQEYSDLDLRKSYIEIKLTPKNSDKVFDEQTVKSSNSPPKKYDEISDFNEIGLARVRINGKYGFINEKGEEVTPCKYDTTYRTYYVTTNNLIPVKLNNKWGFIDKTGREVAVCKYDDDGSAAGSNGLLPVNINWKWGFIDETGKEVIPCMYEDFYQYINEGLAVVKLNGKWGYVDKTNKEILPFKYDYANSFSGGLACVDYEGKCGFIDKVGQEIIPYKYEPVESTHRRIWFSGGLASVRLNGKWGAIDKSGNVIIPFIYDDSFYFSDGNTVDVSQNGKKFKINKQGKRID